MANVRFVNAGDAALAVGRLSYRFTGWSDFRPWSQQLRLASGEFGEMTADGLEPRVAGPHALAARFSARPPGGSEHFFIAEGVVRRVREAKAARVVLQNVSLSGAAGITVSAPDYGDAERADEQQDTADLRVQRDMQAEEEARGYADKSYADRLTTVEVPVAVFTGRGALGFIGRPAVVFGRARPEADGDVDVALRAPGRDDLTRRLSRRHFALVVRDGRVIVEARGAAGLSVNGLPIASGAEARLHDGDVLSPFEGGEGRDVMAWRTRFQKRGRRIEVVRLDSGE
ncbi:MAG: FHA domain-containing protein [Planctomycetes bacterium]|nr:FHA domain-containing protein [Planctomycetota bacterium]